MLEVDLNTLPGLWVFAAPLKRTITIARSGAEERVHFRLGTFVWEPLIGNLGEGIFVWGVRSGNFVLELPLAAFGVESSFGNSRSETVVWEPSFVNLW